ncbi:hypothetical protein KAU11_01200 [Candidatus Babeliales bacterium]|nr:hypothetical protein [Candidatus Babeliales bacterium]
MKNFKTLLILSFFALAVGGNIFGTENLSPQEQRINREINSAYKKELEGLVPQLNQEIQQAQQPILDRINKHKTKDNSMKQEIQQAQAGHNALIPELNNKYKTKQNIDNISKQIQTANGEGKATLQRQHPLIVQFAKAKTTLETARYQSFLFDMITPDENGATGSLQAKKADTAELEKIRKATTQQIQEPIKKKFGRQLSQKLYAHKKSIAESEISDATYTIEQTNVGTGWTNTEAEKTIITSKCGKYKIKLSPCHTPFEEFQCEQIIGSNISIWYQNGEYLQGDKPEDIIFYDKDILIKLLAKTQFRLAKDLGRDGRYKVYDLRTVSKHYHDKGKEIPKVTMAALTGQEATTLCDEIQQLVKEKTEDVDNEEDTSDDESSNENDAPDTEGPKDGGIEKEKEEPCKNKTDDKEADKETLDPNSAAGILAEIKQVEDQMKTKQPEAFKKGANNDPEYQALVTRLNRLRTKRSKAIFAEQHGLRLASEEIDDNNATKNKVKAKNILQRMYASKFFFPGAIAISGTATLTATLISLYFKAKQNCNRSNTSFDNKKRTVGSEFKRLILQSPLAQIGLFLGGTAATIGGVMLLLEMRK